MSVLRIGTFSSSTSRTGCSALMALAELLLGVGQSRNRDNNLSSAVPTGQATRTVLPRLGQDAFSRSVKTNYGNRCCFPGCTIDDDAFLVGSHIARWADAPDLRGHVDNGLALCLMHDRAFEMGIFTLDHKFAVVIRNQTLKSTWAKETIGKFSGHPIRRGLVTPSLDALRRHWIRNSYKGSEGGG